VYGDAGGAWVDETAPAGRGRRIARAAADADWLALGARVFRLPGIYGPGRSPLDRVREGRAHRTGMADQVFSRVHVDDIVAGLTAGFDGPTGAYNLADDEPASQDAVIAYAAGLLGMAPPPVVALDSLSPAARAFYAENRRVANGKARRVLGWRPRYPDYRLGLRALNAATSPAAVSAAPAAASHDQR
jgi:nucleoside-diphosphate-sugar epimerase